MTRTILRSTFGFTAIALAMVGGMLGASKASASTTASPPIGYQVGDRAPNFGAADQSGTERSLYDFRGQYVLLDFSAMWCGPSNTMASEENQLINDVNAEGYPFTYVTMLMEQNVGTTTTQLSAQVWAARYRLSAPVLQLDGAPVATSRQAAQLANYDSVSGAAFPTLVLIDPTGNILEVSAGMLSEPEIMAWFPPRPA